LHWSAGEGNGEFVRELDFLPLLAWLLARICMYRYAMAAGRSVCLQQTNRPVLFSALHICPL